MLNSKIVQKTLKYLSLLQMSKEDEEHFRQNSFYSKASVNTKSCQEE